MKLSEIILGKVADKHLLKHCFYQSWDAGELDMETLRTYGRQYYHHVAAFPRYISATHAQCTEIADRQKLLNNLIDEEIGEENHPALWLDFVEGLGATAEEARNEKLLPQTKNLIDTFFKLAHEGYAEGLAALYVYEQQVPAICETKIRGLKDHYGVSDERSLKYFDLHHTLDVEHSRESAELVDKLTSGEAQRAVKAAETAAKALWGFLDGMEELRRSQIN